VVDRSGPVGTWYLKTWYYEWHYQNGDYRYHSSRLMPLAVNIIQDSSSGGYSGVAIDEETGQGGTVDRVSWNTSTRRLVFRRRFSHDFRSEWYNGKIVQGVIVGRFSHHPDSNTAEQPPFGSTRYYINHFTGWNSNYIDGKDIVPRVYDIIFDGHPRGVDGQCRALLRIDRKKSGLLGTMKVYASSIGATPEAWNAESWDIRGEELECDLENIAWDGTTLSFTRVGEGWSQEFTGTANGRTISGTFTDRSGTAFLERYNWNGSRAQVLTYGLASKSRKNRELWQERTRSQLCHLIMAGNPVANTRHEETTIRIALGSNNPYRDDNPLAYPQQYTLKDISFSHTIQDPYSSQLITRCSHALLAAPTRSPPAGGYPAVIALNGHNGSAWTMILNPDEPLYWYGDSFARRGFVVLAVDISHRNDSPLYGQPGHRLIHGWRDGWAGGDDLNHGNGPHPSIKSPGFNTSDWEENGERTWDVMRALDYLIREVRNINRSCILVTGLSMGGEIATIAAALDLRFSMVVPACWSPDAGVFYHANINRNIHIEPNRPQVPIYHPCGNWVYADNREYVDTSDYHALIAPRPLIVQSGKQDTTYSRFFEPPFAGDKTVTRRSRIAYNNRETDKFIHYLHYDGHVYRVGDINSPEIYVRVPNIIAPRSLGELEWQTDRGTRDTGKTLFEYIESLGYCWHIDPFFSFPYELYCPEDCIIRSPTDPEILKDPVDWLLNKDVTVFLKGKVNGLILLSNSKKIRTITVSPGTIPKRYKNKTKEQDELNIIESEHGEGFDELKGCLAALQNGEIIKGIILRQNEIAGIISGKKEFKEETEINNKP
jgi:dienelactone hydrolase